MPETPTLLDHYNTLIAELDKTLSMVRGFWMEARCDTERTQSMKRIDDLLDERLRLMRARDAAAGLVPPNPTSEEAVKASMVKEVKVKTTKPRKQP